MNISLIISTWNNSKRLTITLESLSQCHIPEGISWELVLVNNNCTDDTDSVVEQFRSRLPIKYVKEPRQGVSIARNTGLANALGELIIFTDDDVVVLENWIKNYWKAYFKNPPGNFWGGSIVSDFECTPLEPELLDSAISSVRGHDLGTQERVIKGNEYFLGANWAASKVALQQVGGFDESLGLNSKGRSNVGEESDLMNRLKLIGLQPLYLPNVTLKHFVPASKCTLTHIGKRIEESGRHQSFRYVNDPSKKDFGIPRWIIRESFQHYLKWIFGNISGKRKYQDYIKFRNHKGIIRGLLEHNKNRKGGI
jgi:glycosyltransferase involved in cell wall biosynthesis